MNRSEVEILDNGLSRIQSDEVKTEDFLQEFPEHEGTLGVLLGLAEEIRAHLTPVGPDDDFVSTSPARILNLLRAKRKVAHKRERRWAWRPKWPLKLAWRPAYLLITALLAIGILGTTAGVAWASTGALPGDNLYGVKRSIEEARLVLTWTATGDAALLAGFADERLNEIEALLAVGREDDIRLPLAGYEDLLTRLLEVAEEAQHSGKPGSLEHLQTSLTQNIRTLERVQAQVPFNAQEAIRSAIEQSNHGREVIEYIRQGGHPSDIAPGQLKKTPDRPSGGPGDHGGGQPATKTPKPKPTKDKTQKP
ncbi:MAG: hypothetical protein AMJ88_05790 [Anaerolineae bacterium SM23_ 63]|nr:MAG: hypothetical protein AMJ88_05790 [Anaerolineae bacterium SM23_ 63]HEY47741.1 hypothetical protein [Anaerolineae bacterium]